MQEITDKAIDDFYGTYEWPDRWNFKRCWDDEEGEEEWDYPYTDSL